MFSAATAQCNARRCKQEMLVANDSSRDCSGTPRSYVFSHSAGAVKNFDGTLTLIPPQVARGHQNNLEFALISFQPQRLITARVRTLRHQGEGRVRSVNFPTSLNQGMWLTSKVVQNRFKLSDCM